MSLIYNATFDSQTRILSLLDKAGNVISSCEVPSKELVDDITKPLTFRATQDGSSVRLTKDGSPSGSFQTSRDGGKTWTDYSIDTSITLNTGDEVSFRAKSNRTSKQAPGKYFHFMMEGKIEAWHNAMSLYRTNDFATYNTAMDDAFYRMFSGCKSLTKAPALPATKIAPECYYYMFENCTSLTEAPVLPATTLASECYRGMFNGCTSLTKAPALPVTTLGEICYGHMFSGCTSLTEAPELPATTLAGRCYEYMFSGCTSLTEAPELPATKLATECYSNMFNGCTSLTKAPALLATTLADKCYQYMFNGCSNLNEVRCKISSSYSNVSSYTSWWLSNVSSTGTFYTNADANWPSGASGIPYDWTRVNESAPTVDDITKPLTFRATQDGSSVTLTKNGSPTGDFQTSRDGGNTWTDYTLNTAITLNAGDEVSFRSKADRSSEQSDQNYFYFMMEGKIEAWHNVMSLYRTNDFSTYNTVVNYAFYRLFKDVQSLTKAPVLPATTLANNCYSNMFHGCTSLTKAPVLPATDFMIDFSLDGSNCYESMFSGCTSLTEAPELPATRLNRFCYYNMFYDCTSLKKAPKLPATTLEESCYESMFSGCASLTEAPELPATTLAFDCYSGMFNYCTSLVNAPALPATTLKSGCYNWMFARCIKLKKSPELTATKLATRCYNSMFIGCGSLNEVHCQMPSTISAKDIPKYTTNGSEISPDQWLSNVSSTGTFYTNADANWPSGASGIPTSWNRVNT